MIGFIVKKFINICLKFIIEGLARVPRQPLVQDGHCLMANGLEIVLAGLQIVIVGPKDSPKTHELVSAVLGRSLPNRLLMVVGADEVLPEGHPASGKKMENGQPTAYICQHENCSAPISNAVTLSQVLQLPPRPPQGSRPQ